jgi:sRNA-binding carbon storage regulator CsrA
MLVLTRKVGEKLFIYPTEEALNMTVEELFADGDISIEVSDINGGQVKLGIEANKKLGIVREEIDE